jgi:DNA mismatch repair protein MSH2
VQKLSLLDEEESLGGYSLSFGSLDSFMRLDSAAAEAVNLLPRPDHPSSYGSLFGILNRCKSKMGSRMLERWLRQPLTDHEEINRRLDFVEALKDCTVSRNRLIEGPLKGLPDLDSICSR